MSGCGCRDEALRRAELARATAKDYADDDCRAWARDENAKALALEDLAKVLPAPPQPAEHRPPEPCTFCGGEGHAKDGDQGCFVCDGLGVIYPIQPGAPQPAEVAALRGALERIAWHELSGLEARDVARAALDAARAGTGEGE